MSTQTIETLQFSVKGMSCAGCVRSVQKALSSEQGVVDSRIRVGDVTVVIDSNLTDARKIEMAIKKTGFMPELQEGERQ